MPLECKSKTVFVGLLWVHFFCGHTRTAGRFRSLWSPATLGTQNHSIVELVLLKNHGEWETRPIWRYVLGNTNGESPILGTPFFRGSKLTSPCLVQPHWPSNSHQFSIALWGAFGIFRVSKWLKVEVKTCQHLKWPKDHDTFRLFWGFNWSWNQLVMVSLEVALDGCC